MIHRCLLFLVSLGLLRVIDVPYVDNLQACPPGIADKSFSKTKHISVKIRRLSKYIPRFASFLS